MNFRKLFFYLGLISLSSLTNLQAAGRDVLIQDTNDDNRALVYADGSLTGMAPIAVITRLKAMWGEDHIDLIRSIVRAGTPAERLTILRAHKNTIRSLEGVSSNFNTLIRPAVAPKRPRDGAPARAEPTHMKGRGILSKFFADVDEEDEDLKRNAEAREEGAATTIQSGWRGMKGRRAAAERRREMAAMDADLTDVAEGYRAKARTAADDYDRFGPTDEEYREAKKDWQKSHNTKVKGWHDRMLRDLKAHFPKQVARDRQYKK